MIVTQANYEYWQHTYQQRNLSQTQKQSPINQTNDLQATSIEGQPVTANRQTSATIETNQHSEEKDFLQIAFERTLNKRLGIDQKKMDEIKEEIKDTETAIEALQEQKPLSSTQKKTLESLQAELEKLKEALETLIKQAMDRKHGDDVNHHGTVKHQLVQYKTIANI
ncbi:hypothetical protein [Glaciecola sp. 1036]|uniref:hypothetical protein n=1 Tax=Alteromonadaceae TaxID=72275 RepID=UPI003D01F726